MRNLKGDFMITKQSPKIYLSLLSIVLTFSFHRTQAFDDLADLSAGKIEAVESTACSKKIDDLTIKITKKLNQDSTNFLPLVIMIKNQIASIKFAVEENPNGAYQALLILEGALDRINEIDLLEQEKGIFDSPIDSSDKTYTELESLISQLTF
jgi:hypothetical protein